MSDTSTKKMIAAYFQRASVMRFLSGFFRSPPENFYTTEKVQLDVERSEEDIAIAITDHSTGYRMNEASIYTNKEFIPPVFKEASPVNAFDLLKRSAGNNPFADLNFQAEATARSLKQSRLVEAKIRRTIELQASQILTTGVVDLINADGVTIYTLDYKPKSTHFPTAAPWNTGTPVIAADLNALAEILRSDGLMDPDMIIMGSGSYEAAITDTTFKARFDSRRADVGSIVPMRRLGNGAQYRGVIELGTYRLDIFTYGGRYNHPQTGVSTKYVPDKKVIMLSSDSRFDATFGAVPRFAPPDSRVLPFLPRRMTSSRRGLDLFPNAWITPDGEQLIAGLASRPLLIPTAIDQYGCIDTDLA